MSFSIDNLSSGFSTQFNKLCGPQISDGMKLTSLSAFIVGDSAVQVTSKMKRQVHTVPQGILSPTGKLSVNKVSVFVNPADEKIVQAIASHFKGLYFPQSIIGEAPERLFSEIMINKKKII